MDPVIIEVIGVNPPCKRCIDTQKNVEHAVSHLKGEGIDVSVKKLTAASKEVILKYGVILTPALAVNGQLKVSSRIPHTDEIVKIIKESK